MRILVFGITGSIGQSLLKVLEKHHKLVGVSFNTQVETAQQIIEKYKIAYYWCNSNSKNSNVQSIDELILKAKPDLIVNAVSGYNGLFYTLKTIEHKIDLALANKESLVMAGHLVMPMIKKAKLHLFPIDSEHSAMSDLLTKCNQAVKQLYITCSGGSCYKLTTQQKQRLKYSQIIKHPKWNMGEKISFDSATLMNKCFEIVECYHLFKTKSITAVYHPQSIVHAIVEYEDHSLFAHLATPDMQLAIQAALNGFKKSTHAKVKPLTFNELHLDFDQIDKKLWKPMQWADEIMHDKNHCLGAIITVANEKAIAAFKNKQIAFDKFYSFIENYINKYKNTQVKNLKQLDDLIKLILDN